MYVIHYTRRISLASQKQFYHLSLWSRRVDQNGCVRPSAALWLPANKSLYSADQDQQGNKFCITCQTRGHNLTTCAAAHNTWKKRQVKDAAHRMHQARCT